MASVVRLSRGVWRPRRKRSFGGHRPETTRSINSSAQEQVEDSMFYLVQHSDDPHLGDHTTVISSHPTADEAFAAVDRRRSILRRLGLSIDTVDLVVVGEDGFAVSRA